MKSLCQSCTTPEDRKSYAKKKRERQKQKETGGPTGEWELFVKIWLERPDHICEGCGKKITVMTPTAFSHTIRTKEDESLRLEKENIDLECFDCHTIWDTGTWEQILGQRNFSSRMAYIKRVRPDLYARKALKIEEFTGVDITKNK